MDSFLDVIDTHLDLIVAVVSFFMALLTIAGSFLWHKFIIQSTAKDVERLKAKQDETGTLVANVGTRITSIEVSVSLMRDDLRMIKNHIIGNKDN